MAIMYHYSILRRNLISLSLKHHRNNPSWSLCKTHFSSSSSSIAAVAEEKRVTVADYLQHRHQFSQEAVSKLASSGKYLRDPEKCDSVLSYFKEIGFSTTHLQRMINRFPNCLSSNLDLTIKPKIKLLRDAGLSPTEIPEIISGSPWILSRGITKVSHTVSELKRVLGSGMGLFRILKNWYFTWDLNKTMVPNMELLLSCGITSSQMASLVHHNPKFLLQAHERFKKCVERAEEMGCDRTSKMFVYAVRTISSTSPESWERRLEVFRSLGFSEDDIRSAFRRYPHVFAISESKIRKGTKALLSARNGDISVIVDNPQLLIYSVEKTIKPRLRVLEALESKNLIAKKPRLTTIMILSNEDFLRRFVLPYSAEIGTIYSPKKALVEK